MKKRPKPSSKKQRSLEDLSEEEIFVLLSCLEIPEVIRRIASCDKMNETARCAPVWLARRTKNMKVTPLFSVAEGDHVEGVAYVIADLAAREWWLGVAVASGSNDTQDFKIPCAGDMLTASDIYPVWTNLLSYEHPDLMDDIFGGGFRVYDKKLLPQKRLQQFKKEVATKPKRLGSFGIISRYI